MKNSSEPLFIMLWGGDANKLTPLTKLELCQIKRLVQ